MLMPIPINKNINNKIGIDCVKATVTAVPIYGAEHGVARSVAKKPLKKFFYKKSYSPYQKYLKYRKILED